jgi:glycosyltransferase involved in cell wall biosynthesis
MPKLSVRIPTLNNYPGLVRALTSILAQEFDDYDLIIVDNNSDDGSWPKTQALAAEYPRVQVVQNNQRGLAENWNYCVQTATGEYVLVFHSDDEMLPGMLQKAVAFLDEHPSVGLVHSNCYDLSEIGKQTQRITQTKTILVAGTDALMKIATNCNVACSTVVVRRECYDRLGLFLPGNPSPDAEMWARIVSQYDMGHIAEPLVMVYAHLDSHGRAALSKYPPAEIERQWRVMGDKINSYFSDDERPAAILRSRGSGFNGLCAAGNLAWEQRRWRRGHEFFLLARRYTNLQTWIAMYVKSVLRAIKRTILHPDTQT